MTTPGGPQDEKGARPDEGSTTSVTPLDVVLVGGGIMGASTALVAMMTYRGGEKALVEDGIDPSTRLRLLPMAARTFALSLVMTSALGAAGFYALQSTGFFKQSSAQLPSAREAARLLRDPRAFLADAAAEERKAQAQAQAGGDQRQQQ